jgi:PAS domain S-box-containing protein
MLRMSEGTNLSKTAPEGQQPTHFRVYRDGREVPPEELPMQYAASHGVEVRGVEEDIVFDDGTVAHVYGSASPLFDEAGEVRGAVAGFLDVSALRQAEASRHTSEERLRTLSDNLPLGAVYQGVGDSAGQRRFTYLSAGVERLFGVTPAEALSDATALYALVHEEDRSGLVAAEEVALRNLAAFHCEFRSWNRSGELRWVHARSAPRRLPDGQIIWEGILLDVTDRKKAEDALHREQELLGTIIDRIPVMLTLYEPDTKVLRLNPAFEKAVGWSSRDAARLSLMEECYPDPAYRQQVWEFMQSCRDGWMDIRMRTRDGRDLETSWANVRLSNGTHVGIGIDITDRKEYEQSLKEADRRKDEFLAMLAHELRNPLAPIRHAAQVFRLLAPAEPNLQRAQDMIERQVQEMTRLVDDLLDVSRITRGKIGLTREPLDLAVVIAAAVETSRPLIDAHRHQLLVSLPGEPLGVEADATRLAQVISNLLNNAAKYTSEDGHIWLTVEACPGEAVVRVRDDGVGIPPDLLPQVFDLFVQGDRSLARSEGGLGIGLTVVKSLVEMHGGSVEARSEGPGKGSEFIVRLPAVEMQPAPAKRDDEGGLSGPSRRVLVVDDNEDVAHSLALLLQIKGHEVRTAHDGLTALNVAGEFLPEVVLLDIGLPTMDGYEVARRLRQQTGLENVVLVAVTGYGQEEDRRRAEEAGFDAHLTKPAEPAALQRLLARTE